MSRAFRVIPIACAIVGLVLTGVRAAGDRVAFPENYAAGALYWVQDRPANKQVREYYIAPAAALQAARQGQPMPSGTVITVVQYNTQLDGQGNPVTGADGRFIKTDIRGYTVMEKRTGWGAEYPAEMRNGDWEYQTFTAAKTANANADLKTCFTCHKPQEKTDFLFSIENMKTSAR